MCSVCRQNVGLLAIIVGLHDRFVCSVITDSVLFIGYVRMYVSVTESQ